MPCLITTISDIKKTTRKKTIKIQYRHSQAPINNVKLLSDKTLKTQKMGFFLKETS